MVQAAAREIQRLRTHLLSCSGMYINISGSGCDFYFLPIFDTS